MKLFSVCVCVLALTAAGARAAVIEDFEGYNVGDAFGTGTIVEDPADAGNKVLSIVYTGSTQYATIPIPDAPVAGIVGMDVYDFGGIETTDAYGARWGIGTDGTNGFAGAMLYHRSWLNSANGYGMSALGRTGVLPGRTSSWFSAKYFGGPRLAGWSNWTFTTSGYKATLDNGTVSNTTDYDDTGLITDAWFYSGSNDNLYGILVDNVSFAVPEPATLGLLALGALGLIRRRR